MLIQLLSLYLYIIKNENAMETLDFIKDLGSSDFESWILVQQAYKQNAFNEDIMECGFNKNSGYVYIALENGVQIASCFGQDVVYIHYDFETGEEDFFDTYNEAIFMQKLMDKINNQ